MLHYQPTNKTTTISSAYPAGSEESDGQADGGRKVAAGHASTALEPAELGLRHELPTAPAVENGGDGDDGPDTSAGHRHYHASSFLKSSVGRLPQPSSLDNELSASQRTKQKQTQRPCVTAAAQVSAALEASEPNATGNTGSISGMTLLVIPRTICCL